MHPIIYNSIGIIGDFCILSAYFMLQWGKLQAHRLPYLLLNLTGALCLLFTMIFQWNLSVFIIEIAWGSISIFGIYKYLAAKTS